MQFQSLFGGRMGRADQGANIQLLRIEESGIVREAEKPYPVPLMPPTERGRPRSRLRCFCVIPAGSCMFVHASPFRFLIVVVMAGTLVMGCEGTGTPPNVPSGDFTAYVEGSVSDTLSGEARYRTTEEGAISTVELAAKGEPGLSIELEPQPPALRTYEIVAAELFGLERKGQPPGAMAFLSVKNAQFYAVDGTFELTYVSDEEIGATFSFQMNGEFEEVPSDAPSVDVNGVVNAPGTP